jgi:hypothetical protein
MTLDRAEPRNAYWKTSALITRNKEWALSMTSHSTHQMQMTLQNKNRTEKAQIARALFKSGCSQPCTAGQAGHGEATLLLNLKESSARSSGFLLSTFPSPDWFY